MSRIVHVSVKNDKNLFKKLKDKSINFFSEILPSDIEKNEEIVIENDLSVTAILNPTKAVSISGKDALIGLTFEEDNNIWKKFGYIPEGSYVIKRENYDTIEFVTDYEATKSLWYYNDETIFICSSSQRFIVHLLGDFQLNEQAVMWMLSSGTLGYKNSWDKRIKSIPPATILKLDKSKWEFDINTIPIEFKSNNKSLRSNIKTFDSLLNKVFSNLNIEKLKPLLAITGGYDSRTNFLYQKKVNKLCDISTFGAKETIDSKVSDLFCGRKFSEKYQLNWLMFDTKWDLDDLSSFFDKFIKLGEGRLDLLERISNGNDWMKTLFIKKYDILINGMEGFSSQYPFSSQKLNLHLRKLFMSEDFLNFPPDLKLAKQKLHNDLKKMKSDKTWYQYYHRLNQLFFNPYGDTALNEIQNCYVDTVNPLLSKSIIRFIRELPDKQRIQKRIAKEIVHKLDDSQIPFADQVSVYQTADLVKLHNFSTFFDQYIKANNNGLFPNKAIDDIIKNTKETKPNKLILNTPNKQFKLKKYISKYFPTLVHKWIENKKNKKNLIIDYYMLKYRIFIVLKVVKLLSEDAKRYE